MRDSEEERLRAKRRRERRRADTGRREWEWEKEREREGWEGGRNNPFLLSGKIRRLVILLEKMQLSAFLYYSVQILLTSYK